VSVSPVRFGEADLTTCDREPIHIPGSIQPHGVLLVLDRRDLHVEQVAGDSSALLGLEPDQLPGMPLSEVLDEGATGFVGARFVDQPGFIAPIMLLAVRSRRGPALLDLTAHACDGTVIIELEPARRSLSGAGDPIAQLKLLLSAVRPAETIDASCAAAAAAMRAVTGFDRAMVYRFLPDDSGVVAAEDAAAGLESFLGLHYPASDIPQQARELYRRNWLRAIPDIDYVPAPLRPAVNGRTQAPIDMSHCDLRSVSPIHLEYLRNMGVCASLSASLITQERLWGMLVLHHYSPRRVAADLRVALETFAQVLSRHIQTQVQAETSALRIEARRLREQLITRIDGSPDIAAALCNWELLRYVGAAGAVVALEGRLHTVGSTPDAAEVAALVQWLNRMNRTLFATEHLSAEFAPASAWAAVSSGLLAIAVSRVPRDYVMWFRPEIGRTVRWAGDPSKQIKVARHGARLTPRGSFAEWLEVTRMHSDPWSEVDLEAAEALRVVMLDSVVKSLDRAQREREFAATLAMTEELERRVAERTEQLRLLSADLEAVEEKERRQIAHDLHDEFGQTLAAAQIHLASLRSHEQTQVRATAERVGALIEQASMAVSSLATQLAPDVLHELGLSAALESLGEDIGRTFGLRVTLRSDARPPPLSTDTSLVLYRAVRELLINVAKHARTGTAVVECSHGERRIVVRVLDQGIGYDAAAVATGRRRGLGLAIVRERMALIGGTVDIRSGKATGTVVTLTAPVSAAAS